VGAPVTDDQRHGTGQDQQLLAAGRSALFRAMNNVWQARCRVLVERLETLARQLGKKQQIPPTAFEEHTVRLLAGAIMMLRQHQVNKRGQCKYCAWTSRTWWLWHRRPQCTVCPSLDFAMSQPLDLVWEQLLPGPKARR
jgi:hypothetical protein